MASSSQEEEREFSCSTAKIQDSLDSVYFKQPLLTAEMTAEEEGDLSSISLPLNDSSVLPPFYPGLSSLPEDPPHDCIEERDEQETAGVEARAPTPTPVQVTHPSMELL